MINVGFFGSCQLNNCIDFFINNKIKKEYNINVKFSLYFFEYDSNYSGYKGTLDYSIFNELDILVIELNSLENQASSTKIIDYLQDKDVKIIKTFLIKFPIYPINWSGYGENKTDYLNWTELDNIDYKEKFKKCIKSMRRDNSKSDLSEEITSFVENNFNKQLLFTHSLHPTNILLYELWKYILQHLSINIKEHEYIFTKELIDCWYNPFTNKMMTDLNIEFKNVIVNDYFYINRYYRFRHMLLKD